MATVAMSGADTIKVNDRILADLADGDCVHLTYPNEIASVKTGKNGNSIFGKNETGKQAELALRVIRGSSDDKYLNNLMAIQDNAFQSFVLLTGEFIKRVGNGAGLVSSDTIVTSGGVFSKRVEAKSNVDGDSEQSVAVYHVKYSVALRVIT